MGQRPKVFRGMKGRKNMNILRMRCDRLLNPLGQALEDCPSLSWVIAGEEERTLLSQVEVSRREDFGELLFSGEKSDQTNNISYPLTLALRPRTRYYWRVRLFEHPSDTTPVTVSHTAWFETGKLSEPWQARWITPEPGLKRHPIVFSAISLPEKPVLARAYVCGLGLYELSVNGTEPNEYLTPGLCAYDKWLPYQTYDLTAALKKGSNQIELLLGNGWYKGRYGLMRKQSFHYGEDFSCILELHVRFADGREQVFGTDEGWSAKESCLCHSGIFDGEIRDDAVMSAEQTGVRLSDPGHAPLQARRGPPVKIMDRLKPIALIRTPAGETLLDMGQNMTGWLSFEGTIPKGTQIHLQFGELLQNGNFYRDNLRTALAEYRYTGDGRKKTIRPHFTFYGFRYVKLTAWHQAPEEISLSDFTGLVLYSQMDRTGWIETGDEKVNRLFENTLWGQQGNFLDVPTDCPQRDERMGWTGDAQVFFGTAAFNMDVSAFYRKFCYDLMREQESQGGAVPVVIPKHDVRQTGACAWGDAATIIPWNLYVRYGDPSVLARQYPSMKAWVDHIRRQDEKTGNSRLWQGSFHYGDWLALDNEDPLGNRFGGTDKVYLASCYYCHSALLTAKAAQVLGKTREAAAYRALSQEVRAAILREYFTETGRLAVTTQTAYVLALMFEIVPERWRPITAAALRGKLKESNYHLRTGFIGTPYLCRVLSENGSNDIAYRLLLQEDFPSWLYQVNLGATTVWERWNSVLPDGRISDTGMNSMNHYAYGSVMEWLYQNAGGIRPLEDFPGFRRFRLAPQPDPRLGKLDLVFEAPSGRIQSKWAYQPEGGLVYEFGVPYGTRAELVLPHEPARVTELPPGNHRFSWQPPRPPAKYGPDTPISQLWAVPALREALEKALPQLTGMMLFPMMAGEKSLSDLVSEKYLTPAELAGVDFSG